MEQNRFTYTWSVDFLNKATKAIQWRKDTLTKCGSGTIGYSYTKTKPLPCIIYNTLISN